MIIPEALEKTLTKNLWRKEPILIKGGARQFFDPLITMDRFNQLCNALAEVRADLLYRPNETVAFAQNLDLVGEEFRQISDQLKQQTAGAAIWFDGVMAENGMGIGSHYDIADAFLLQQYGCKIWRLHDPDFICEEEKRARFLNETDVDCMYMPDTAREYILEAGDLLYLPILWVHWGVSRGSSVSVSLALTSRNALQWLFPALERVLATYQPEKAPEQFLSWLCDALQQSNFRNSLYKELWHGLYEAREERAISTTKLPPTLSRTLTSEFPLLLQTLKKHRPWWQPVPVIWGDPTDQNNPYLKEAQKHFDTLFSVFDISNLGELFEHNEKEHPTLLAVSQSPAPSIDVSPYRTDRSDLYTFLENSGWAQDLLTGFDKLKSRLADLYAERLILASRRCYEQLSSKQARKPWFMLLTNLSQIPAERLRKISLQPEITSWIWRAAGALQHGYLRYINRIANWLPYLLSAYQEIDYLLTDLPAPANVVDDSLYVLEIPSYDQEISRNFAYTWIKLFFPKGSMAENIIPLSNSSAKQTDHLQHYLLSVISELSHQSPRLAQLVRLNISLIALRKEGITRVDSLAPFPGLIFVPENISRQELTLVLIHESIRRIAYDLLETFEIFKPCREVGYFFPFLELSLPRFANFHKWFVQSFETGDKSIDPLLNQSDLSEEGRFFVNDFLPSLAGIRENFRLQQLILKEVTLED
ncbi:MAG: cupin domain-containing protein [Acidobacteriota bacterium]